MANKSNEKLAHKLLITFERLLIFIGKPFYLLLSYFVIAVLFVFYLAGHVIIKTLQIPISLNRYINTKIIKVRPVKITIPKVKLVFPIIPKLKFPKIQLPHLKIPEFKIHIPKFKLFFLRLRLFQEKFISVLRLKIRLRPHFVLSRKISQVKLKPGLKLRPKLNFRFVAIFLSLSLFLFLFWFNILHGLPSPKELITREQEVSTKIYDRNRVLLYNIYKNKNRTPVSLSQIPTQVRLATLAAEDAEFYNHLGFSIRGIGRALIKNIKEGKLTGGSTITQQLVKNALLSPEKTLVRKIKEIILSIGVEITFSKDQILEMYLNEVSYGGTAYGIQEAARVYFGKDVEALSLAEAALLAGLPKSPTKFSPFGQNPELATARKEEVLNLMEINKFITNDEKTKAEKEILNFSTNKTEIKAPHFVMYVRQLLVDKFGEEVVEKGGLEVLTTLDYEIQKIAEEAVISEIKKLIGYNVGNGAALVLNPTTGEILAMVGSKDYFDIKNDGNVNVTTALRQPGSSIKVVNYAYALSNGYTPATILDDSPISYSVPGQPIYSPKNYDGKYRGKLSLRNAFAESRNIPAVKVLASYGVTKMIEIGKKMGITTWEDPSRYGLSLTLGGGEVRLIDLAQVYATVANYGKKLEISSIIKVTNYKGKVLEESKCSQFSCDSKQVLDPKVAYLIIDILKDSAARIPAFGVNSALVVVKHPEVAVKTGTSNDLKDNLTFGFNQQFLVAVWVGNNNAKPMARIASGITGAAPIWNKIISSILSETESEKWAIPKGVIQISICQLTGTLPCEGCPLKTEFFSEDNKPTKYCSSEQIKKIQEEKLNTPNPSPTGQILENGASTQRR